MQRGEVVFCVETVVHLRAWGLGGEEGRFEWRSESGSRAVVEDIGVS